MIQCVNDRSVDINPLTIAAARVAVAERHLRLCQGRPNLCVDMDGEPCDGCELCSKDKERSARFVEEGMKYLALAHEHVARYHAHPDLIAWMREHPHVAERIMTCPMGTREVAI